MTQTRNILCAKTPSVAFYKLQWIALTTMLLVSISAHATCVSGGGIIEQICVTDNGQAQTPTEWYFTGWTAFTGASDIASLTTLVQQEYTAIVSDTSITFVDGESGFTSAALTKLTNLQAYDYFSQLCFLTGPFDPNVEPSLGSTTGPTTLTPQGPRSTCPVCQSTFTSSAGTPSAMTFCTLQNGNIVQFAAPTGIEYLESGVAEGYAICDTSAGGSSYYDWGGFGDSTAWNDAVITQPNGPNTFPLTVARTTADNLWILTQDISRTAATRSASVTMKLKNNSSSSRSAQLIRYADIDAHSNVNNRFDFTLSSAWGYIAPTCTPTGCTGDYGLVLQSTPTSYPYEAYVQNTPNGPNPCNVAANVPETPFNGDGSVLLQFTLQNISKNGSNSVTINYHPQ